MVSDMAPLRRLGFTPREVDLRDYVGKPDRVAAVLADHPVLWVRGGNTFVLRAQLARSGADAALLDLLRRDAVVYAGYSAGACVTTPTLRGVELFDDPAEVRPTCGIDPVWEGLGLVDRPIVPHVDSPMADQSTVERAVIALRSLGGVWALRDDQVVVVDGAPARVLS